MAINKNDLEQLLNQARVTLVGASEGGLKGAFYDVLSEFFNDSSCWTQCIPVSAIPNVTLYPLQVNEGQVLRLVGVSTPFPPQGTPQNATSVPGGVPIPALMPEIGTLILKNSPVSATQYIAEVVTNVAQPVDRAGLPQAPDWVIPVWHVGLLDGLLGKMMVQPNKSYSNLTQGAYHLKRFRDVIARARVSKLRANTNGAQAWRFPQQYRSTSQQGGVPAVGSASERSF